MKIKILTSILTVCISSGCMVTHSEVQHFRTDYDPPNYFRLSIESTGFLSRAKYSSGFYDEKALDIFLNEFGSKDYAKSGQVSSISQSDEKTMFDKSTAETTSKDGHVQLKPLSSNGVYAYIFSTNADDIARTIGAFAENQVVADYISALINKEKLTALDDKEKTLNQKAGAIASIRMELEGLISQVPDQPGNDAQPDLSSYIYLLTAIARGVDLQASFKNLDEAKAFFDALPSKP